MRRDRAGRRAQEGRTVAIRASHLLLLAAALALVYGHTLQNGFVYDDEGVVNNPLVRRWANLPLLFTPDYFPLSAEATYRPLVTLTYFVDHSLWPGKAAGYHLTNLLLHLLAAVMTYLLVMELTGELAGKDQVALLTSFLFLLHPVNSEVVNAIGFREDSLAAALVLLALLLIRQARSRHSPLRYGLSVAAYLSALFAKEMALAFLPLLLLHDLCLRTSAAKGPATHAAPARPAWWSYAGHGLATACYLLIRFYLLVNPQDGQEAVAGTGVVETVGRLLTFITVIPTYLRLLLFPLWLNADYVIPPVLSLAQPQMPALPHLVGAGTAFRLGLGLGLSLAGVAALLWLRRRPSLALLLFAGGWIPISLLPVSNLVPLYNVAAERYLYLPTFGFALLVALLLVRWGRGRKGVVVLTLLLLGLYGARTVLRNRQWRDNWTLWSATVQASPLSTRAHYNLGNALNRQGRTEEAIGAYLKAIALNPRQADSHTNLGSSYLQLGRPEEAIAAFQQALRLRPQGAKIWNNLGAAYEEQGKLEPAHQAYRQATRLDPMAVTTWLNLGRVLLKLGRIEEAEQAFQEVVRLDPSDSRAAEIAALRRRLLP